MFEFTFEWDSCESGAGTNSFEAHDINGLTPDLEELMTACRPGDTIEVTAWNEDTGSEWTIHVTPTNWIVIDSIVNDA